MVKFILITVLVFWLATKLAGFVIRMFLRQAGIRFVQGQQGGASPFGQRQQPPPPQATAQPQTPKRPDSGRMGEYVDFEEVK